MHQPLIPALVLAGLFAATAALAEEDYYRPVQVSPGDCRLEIRHREEVYRPTLRPVTRRLSLFFSGTDYLQEWKNNYPESDRLVSIEPFLSDHGDAIFQLNITWQDRGQPRRELRLRYEQTGESRFLVTHDGRQESRDDVKNGNLYHISYAANGLSVEGDCRFSRERVGEDQRRR